MTITDFVRTNEKDTLGVYEYSDGESRIPVLKYPMLSDVDFVEHCFTTRLGGVSEGIFATMNLSFTRGDEEWAVAENYRRIATLLGTRPERIVTSDQTHTTTVRRVYEKDCGSGVVRPREFTDVDGMITNEPGVVLATFYADCVPLYFVDRRNKAIGLSHSGWRGTVNRMGQCTLDAMKREFGTDPADVIAAIGPSICQACYEVSEDVASQFMENFPGHEKELLIEKGGGKYQLDLWKANEIVLLEAGVLQEHLAVTNICTCCNPDLLFSHRASHGKRGNLGAFLVIKDN